MSSLYDIPPRPSNGTGGWRIPRRRAGAWYSERTNKRGEVHSELSPGVSISNRKQEVDRSDKVD